MNIVQTIQIPTPPEDNLGFYEKTNPTCVLTSPEATQEAAVPLGNYDNLTWAPGTTPTELEEATTWGSKTLPGAGPFYFANHEDGDPTIGHIDNTAPEV